jgi:hypothetical protein
MNQEKSNESIEFAEETSRTRPAPRKGDKELIKEMNEESTDMGDLLDYTGKDIGA